ncbi:uncharacterized protein LOC106673762 [Cimex lectularius]|uniref:Uncharacterized protein n=1 Tax=Cimex lectularius TaxID=79782 RepID=A0A8I6SBP0_CIMLE|nr:uncharacterized protein LOC106673762 [Cimex lectularius]
MIAIMLCTLIYTVVRTEEDLFIQWGQNSAVINFNGNHYIGIWLSSDRLVTRYTYFFGLSFHFVNTKTRVWLGIDPNVEYEIQELIPHPEFNKHYKKGVFVLSFVPTANYCIIKVNRIFKPMEYLASYFLMDRRKDWPIQIIDSDLEEVLDDMEEKRQLVTVVNLPTKQVKPVPFSLEGNLLPFNECMKEICDKSSKSEMCTTLKTISEISVDRYRCLKLLKGACSQFTFYVTLNFTNLGMGNLCMDEILGYSSFDNHFHFILSHGLGITSGTCDKRILGVTKILNAIFSTILVLHYYSYCINTCHAVSLINIVYQFF